MNKTKKCLMVVLLIVVIITLFCTTYLIVSHRIDKKVNEMSDMTNYVTEMDERKIGKIEVYLDGKKYSDLDKLIGKVKAGDSLDCVITYDNDTTTNKKAVVFNASDKKAKHVTHEDKGDNIIYLYLPANPANPANKEESTE